MRDFILLLTAPRPISNKKKDRPLSLLFKHYRPISKSFNFKLSKLGRSITAAIEF